MRGESSQRLADGFNRIHNDRCGETGKNAVPRGSQISGWGVLSQSSHGAIQFGDSHSPSDTRKARGRSSSARMRQSAWLALRIRRYRSRSANAFHIRPSIAWKRPIGRTYTWAACVQASGLDRICPSLCLYWPLANRCGCPDCQRLQVGGPWVTAPHSFPRLTHARGPRCFSGG
jgi:hypothetical protein